MTHQNLPEIFTSTSESDSEYLVDSRYCRTTVKCKRKALKKTIKLIHGRCVVIYRGTGDLLSIAAKDADRNCYCDFVFVCHDRKPVKAVETTPFSRSKSATHDSPSSDDDDDDDDDDDNNNNALEKLTLSTNKRASIRNKQQETFFPFSHCITKAETIEEDVDVDELTNDDEPSSSIIYFPPLSPMKTMPTNGTIK